MLRKFNTFETEDELNERINVLKQLDILAKQWIIKLSKEHVSLMIIIVLNLFGSVTVLICLFCTMTKILGQNDTNKNEVKTGTE